MKIERVVEINARSLQKDFAFREIEYVDISSVGIGTLNEPPSRLRLSEAPSRARRLVRSGDTIISTVRPNRRSFFYLKNPSENTVVSTGFAVLTPTPQVDSRYLYYWVSRPEFSVYLAAHAKGAAYPAVAPEDIGTAEIALPPLPTQRRIASILTTYDDLIENNLRRIKILEEMARALYREWFVEFRFPGHKKVSRIKSVIGTIPKDWPIISIGDVADIFRGRSYGSADLADEGGLPFVNLKCMERDGGFRRSGLKRYTGDYKDTQIVRKGDIVMGVTDMTQERRIVARAALVPTLDQKFGVFSMDLVRIEPKPHVAKPSLYCFFRFSDFADEVKQHANGANVLHLSPERISAYRLAIPPTTLMSRFSKVVGPALELIDALENQTENLRRTRDLLLPQLLSEDYVRAPR